MANEKYTPGPWLVENLMHGGPRIVHGEPDADGFRDDVVFRQPTLQAQANARLIAAAPELLEALKNMLDCANLIAERWESGDLADAVRSLQTDAKFALAAIAKAEGL